MVRARSRYVACVCIGRVLACGTRVSIEECERHRSVSNFWKQNLRAIWLAKPHVLEQTDDCARPQSLARLRRDRTWKGAEISSPWLQQMLQPLQ